MLSVFSWELDYHLCRIVLGTLRTVTFHHPGDLPPRNITTGFNVLFRQYAGVSLLRRHIALMPGNGMFTVCPSTVPCGCVLGPGLTPDPISVDREPLVLRREGFSPSLSLLIPTFAFPGLSSSARAKPSTATGMLPYQSHAKHDSTASATDLCPIIIHAGSLD